MDSEDEIFNHIREVATLYRSQTQTEINEVNLSAWIRRGELDFDKVKENMPPYNKKDFQSWIETKSWEEKQTSTHYFKSLPNVLKKFGVGLVLLPYMPKTVYGAVKWIDGHPVVMISDREQDLATCWYTLFHEFGHVLFHENKLVIDGVINDGEYKGQLAQRERDANKFANHYLFNGDDLRKHIFKLKQESNYEPQSLISEYYNVKPMFVGYWMRKAQYYPAQYHRIPITFS